MDYENFFKDKINDLHNEGRYRVFANLERIVGKFPKALLHSADQNNQKTTKEVIIWCSNDYLGMGHNPVVLDAMKDILETQGAGAGGTRNISGTCNLHVLLEKELADLHHKDAALIFNSGYLANETALSTLGTLLPDCLIISDEFNHASMIQGIRLSKAEKKIFKHNDLDELEAILRSQPKSRPKVVAFESVHSMDGDISPIKKICALCKKYGALSYLDETHAVGLYGPRGGGVAERENLLDFVDIIEGGLGKAYGVVGGFITGSKSTIDAIRSYGSGFIFTTSLPPVVAAGAIASVNYLKYNAKERTLLHARSNDLKAALKELGIPMLQSPSHIVPVLVGDSTICKQITDTLLKEFNAYIQPINYPTVPRGTERLRITPTPFHTKEMVLELAQAISTIWDRLGLEKEAETRSIISSYWSQNETFSQIAV